MKEGMYSLRSFLPWGSVGFLGGGGGGILTMVCSIGEDAKIRKLLQCRGCSGVEDDDGVCMPRHGRCSFLLTVSSDYTTIIERHRATLSMFEAIYYRIPADHYKCFLCYSDIIAYLSTRTSSWAAFNIAAIKRPISSSIHTPTTFSIR